MNPRLELLLWAQRIVGKKDAQPHELLEIKADASLDEAQAAFHKIAKMAHPDLHRGMDPTELDKVTSAYGQVANAYQLFRANKLRLPGTKLGTTERIPQAVPPKRAPTGDTPKGKTPPGMPPLAKPTTGSVPVQSPKPPPTPPDKKPAAGSSPAIKPPAAGSAPAVKPPEDAGVSDFEARPSTTTQMSSKAMLYYRRAEMALRSGDLRGGVLNLKLAIAADPTSQFLRAALAKTEEELKKQ